MPPTVSPTTTPSRHRRGRTAAVLAAGIAGLLAIAGCGTDRYTAASDSHVEQVVKAKIRSLAASRKVTLSELGCYELTTAKMFCTAHMAGSGAPERTTASFAVNLENSRDRHGTHTFVLEGPPQILGS